MIRFLGRALVYIVLAVILLVSCVLAVVDDQIWFFLTVADALTLAALAFHDSVVEHDENDDQPDPIDERYYVNRRVLGDE